MDPSSQTRISLPHIKLYIKSPSFDNICSLMISELMIDVESVMHKAKDCVRLTVDKVHVRDLMKHETVGSLEDIKFQQISDKNDESRRLEFH